MSEKAPPPPRTLDLRDLEPPEPMVQILRALEEMAPGEVLEATLARQPVFFLPTLEQRGLPYTLEEAEPGRWLLRITQA